MPLNLVRILTLLAIIPLAAMIFVPFTSSAFAQTVNAQEGSLETFLDEATVPSSLAKPDIPLSLRSLSAPDVTSRRTTKGTTPYDRTILLGAAPLAIEKKEPVSPPALLPRTEPEPGMVYIVPFTGVEAPSKVYEGVFDLFVDTLNQQSNKHGLQFVIFKQGLKRGAAEELKVRKHITGLIASYVEDSSCCSTNIRAEFRITYYHPNQEVPVFDSVIPVSKSFDHDQSSIETERMQFTEEIATTLSEKLSSALGASLLSKSSNKPKDNGA